MTATACLLEGSRFEVKISVKWVFLLWAGTCTVQYPMNPQDWCRISASYPGFNDGSGYPGSHLWTCTLASKWDPCHRPTIQTSTITSAQELLEPSLPCSPATQLLCRCQKFPTNQGCMCLKLVGFRYTFQTRALRHCPPTTGDTTVQEDFGLECVSAGNRGIMSMDKASCSRAGSWWGWRMIRGGSGWPLKYPHKRCGRQWRG